LPLCFSFLFLGEVSLTLRECIVGFGHLPSFREALRLIAGLVAAPAAAPAAAIAAAFATTPAIATRAAAAATPSPPLPRARLVDRYRTTLDLLAVEGGDGGLRLLLAAHFDEAEPLGLLGGAIRDHFGRTHGAVRREQLLQLTVADAIAQVTDV